MCHHSFESRGSLVYYYIVYFKWHFKTESVLVLSRSALFGFERINVAQTGTKLNRIASLMWTRDTSIVVPT